MENIIKLDTALSNGWVPKMNREYFPKQSKKELVLEKQGSQEMVICYSDNDKTALKAILLKHTFLNWAKHL